MFTTPPIASKICGKCNQLVKGKAFLLCKDCKLYFHLECKGYEKRYYLLDAEKRAKWQCDACYRKSYKTSRSSTSMGPLLQTPPSPPLPLPISSKNSVEFISAINSRNSVDLELAPVCDIADEEHEVIDPYQNVTQRKSYRKGMRSSDEHSIQGESALEMTSALKEYIASQMSAFTNQVLAKIDTLASSLQKFDGRCDKIECRISQIERDIDEKINEKVNDLANTVDRLRGELNDREQELLSNEIEISGVPEANGENPVHIATLVASKLGVTIAERDVVSAVRIGARRESASGTSGPSARPVVAAAAAPPPRPVPNGSSAPRTPPVHLGTATGTTAAAGDEAGPRLLVVRLLRRAQRDDLLRNARVRRGADTAGLGLPGPVRRFYCNERLTRANRLLFRRAREETRRLNWKFAWTRDGAILVRRDNDEPAKRIRTEDDLARVFGVQSVSGQ